jgi:UDP-N-acetylmuramoyl-L-alanyl-D-glutamate--2,6-diaminopimelate ligase
MNIGSSKTLRPINNESHTFAQCARFLGVEGVVSADADLLITGLSDSSREIQSGDLFIAMPGAKSHGATYIDSVVSAGAVAVLTDAQGALLVNKKLPTLIVDNPRLQAGDLAAWFYGNPFGKFAAVGVTGTNGKTTTTALLDQLWQLSERTTGLIGTVGISLAGEMYPVSFTTPEATTLQMIGAAMAERHVKNIAMEVSSHGIAQHRIDGTKFEVVGFTNLTQDHLDFHKDMENYFQTKAKLFTSEFADHAIINIDDQYGARLYENTAVPAESISRNNHKAHWYYEDIHMVENGMGYEVRIRGTGGILIEGTLPLLGLHNVDNALLAIALAVHTGVDPIVIGSVMHLLSAPAGRLEPVAIGQKFIALVDYAHTPDAVAHVLSTARSLTKGRVIAVLGCGGDRDKSKRALMGKALREGSDFAIFTSDNPRGEDPSTILDEMVAGLDLSENACIEADRREAIAVAVAEATVGDCVLVLGKGHERGQEIKGTKIDFDDRIELARAIEGLS